MTTMTEGVALQNTTSARRARAALVRRPQTPLLLEEIEVAAPRADEVLVRMVATGICHTDVVCRDGFPVPMPIVLGHEGAGIVEAVGSGVTDVVPGDHVLLSFNSGGVRLEDGSSALSQSGEKINGQFFGQSSFSSLAIARAVNTVKIDKSLPLAALAPLGCGIQ